ncbi:MAG: geranylgeranyl reductase family protein [Nitrospinota bacterium]
MPSEPFDSIVVGGGPAGTACAFSLAKGGRSVLLLDRKSFPRAKACGGALSRKALLELEPLLGEGLSSLRVREPSRAVFSYRLRWQASCSPQGLSLKIARRRDLDSLLLGAAREAGAEVRERVEALSLEEGRAEITLKVRTERGLETLRAKTLIGADGAGSRIRRALGFPPPQKALGLAGEAVAGEEDPSKEAHSLYFDFGLVPEGYGWVFPAEGHLSIGIFMRQGRYPALGSLFRRFLTHPALKSSRLLGLKGGLLTFRDGSPLHKGGVLLAGDAAGLTDPLTGEGIYQALLSGRLAGEAVEGFLKGSSPLSAYGESLEAGLLPELKIAERFARFLHRHPLATYTIAAACPGVRELICQVMSGSLTYGELYSHLKRKGWAKTLRKIVS